MSCYNNLQRDEGGEAVDKWKQWREIQIQNCQGFVIDQMLGQGKKKKEESRMTPRFLVGATEVKREEVWGER